MPLGRQSIWPTVVWPPDFWPTGTGPIWVNTAMTHHLANSQQVNKDLILCWPNVCRIKVCQLNNFWPNALSIKRHWTMKSWCILVAGENIFIPPKLTKVVQILPECQHNKSFFPRRRWTLGSPSSDGRRISASGSRPAIDGIKRFSPSRTKTPDKLERSYMANLFILI